MKRRRRQIYTEEQKALMWDRWQIGDSLHKTAKAVALRSYTNLPVLPVRGKRLKGRGKCGAPGTIRSGWPPPSDRLVRSYRRET
jgi:hypothetical protein